jgi:ATP-dependent DNA helicase RecG
VEIQYLKGVGPKTAVQLKAMGIITVKDMLDYYPRDYEDMGNVKQIGEMVDGEIAAIQAQVSIIYPSRRIGKGKYMNRIIFQNSTGYIAGVWFNQPYIKNNFKVGQNVYLYGKISKRMGEVQIVDPQYDRDYEGDAKGINPIYPTSKHISQNQLRKLSKQALEIIDSQIREYMPSEILEEHRLVDIKFAIKNIHYPENMDSLRAGIKRLKFDELLLLELGLMRSKEEFEESEGAFSIPICSQMVEFKEKLPFQLTGAQSRTVREVLRDMKRCKPMNRLVQGDVGSGKTMVAAIALFNTAMNGLQGALMAPTEILAEQHYASLNSLVSSWGVETALLTGSTSKKEKEEILEGIAGGRIKIVIGTHALIQDNVEFSSLALVITDEQHRFGVRQRTVLKEKGSNPHVLVMTATPIPRTLAIFMYGDMDISIIDELPPGRQKVDTYFMRPAMRNKVYGFVRDEISKGRQAYVVCSMVEESEKLEVESAAEMQEKLKEEYFSDFQVGLLHGRMSSEEKEEVMRSFKEGHISVLVSTTVIEVGVNVPNATVMVIENAERFGLAQLHQLRGRVGRGKHKSYCILVSEGKTKEACDRLNVLTRTNDGFEIAEKDMQQRGTGEFFGFRQHGLPELKLADIMKDMAILKEAREAAKHILDKDDNSEEYCQLMKEVDNKFNSNIDSKTFN